MSIQIRHVVMLSIVWTFGELLIVENWWAKRGKVVRVMRGMATVAHWRLQRDIRVGSTFYINREHVALQVNQRCAALVEVWRKNQQKLFFTFGHFWPHYVYFLTYLWGA